MINRFPKNSSLDSKILKYKYIQEINVNEKTETYVTIYSHNQQGSDNQSKREIIFIPKYNSE